MEEHPQPSKSFVPEAPPVAPPPLPRGVQERQMDNNKTVTCLVVGIVVPVVVLVLLFILAIAAAIILPALAQGRRSAHKAECAQQQRAILDQLKQYAENHEGYLPLPSLEEGFVVPGVIRSALEDSTDLFCPEDVGAEAEGEASSYFYLGYRVTDLEEAEQLFEAIGAAIDQERSLETDLPLRDGSGTIPRLRMDMPDADEIPVLFERMEQHDYAAMNVVYLDGSSVLLEWDENFLNDTAFWELFTIARQVPEVFADP